MNLLRQLPGWLAGAALIAAAGLAGSQTITPKSRAPVTLNFVNADIEAVTRAMAAMIDRAIVVDPRVKGTITVYSEQPQSIREAWQNYLTAVRGMNFAVVESGGLLKLVPEADAKLQTSTVSVGEVAIRGDQVITQVFTLRYENPNNLIPVLRPLISANNTINATPGTSSLVITDYADNLQRIAKIIAALDQPVGTDIEIVPLQHAVAADIAPLVQRLSDGSGAAAVPGVPGVGGGALTVLADSRSNSLLVRAPNPARLAQVKATIDRLDRPSNLVGPGGGMWVVHLKNADAVRLATVVRAAFSAVGSGGGGSTVGGASGGGTVSVNPTPVAAGGTNAPGASPQATAALSTAAQPSTGGFIQADPATNSLIITAPEPLYKQVRALIDQLDERRAQVYIESLIVEVSGNDAADFGFQWQGLLGQSGDKTGLAGGTNFGAKNNLLGISAAAATGNVAGVASAVGEGLNIGLLRNYNGVTSLAAVLRMLQSTAQTNVVSTPNIVTLDNEEAKIVVGDNVPFITGQFTNTGTATTSPFQTIERKDVGTTLRIKPQIGEGGAIRMTIYQEQSAVQTQVAAGTSNAGPSTTKRSIENTVVVDDGSILVLGGLISDRTEVTQAKVPLLGDLPLIGALFRSESRTRTRSNLMVFLRPVVMRDTDSAARFSTDRYDRIRAQQEANQPPRSVILPINESAVLPPRDARPAAPASAASAGGR